MAEVGDIVMVHVFKNGENPDIWTHSITLDDIELNRVRIDIMRPISVEHSSWGAIKALYK